MFLWDLNVLILVKLAQCLENTNESHKWLYPYHLWDEYGVEFTDRDWDEKLKRYSVWGNCMASVWVQRWSIYLGIVVGAARILSAGSWERAEDDIEIYLAFLEDVCLSFVSRFIISLLLSAFSILNTKSTTRHRLLWLECRLGILCQELWNWPRKSSGPDSQKETSK